MDDGMAGCWAAPWDASWADERAVLLVSKRAASMAARSAVPMVDV